MAKPKLDSAGISLFCESVAMMLAAVSFGTYPDITILILSQMADKRIIQTFFPKRIIRIMSKNFLLWIKIVRTSIIGSYPYCCLRIYINRKYGRMRQTTR